jgi:ubiquitin carboxyl-terminal hydrolase 5/13
MDAGVLAEIRAALPKVKVPTSYDRVYKDECLFSFATPESADGIFVNLNSWTGVGSRFLDLDHQRTGNILYYNEKHKRIPNKQNGPIAQDAVPTRLAIGGGGGFQVDKKDYTIEKECSLALMPKRILIPLPNPELPELVLQAVGAIQVSAESASLHGLSALAVLFLNHEYIEVNPKKPIDQMICIQSNKFASS